MLYVDNDINASIGKSNAHNVVANIVDRNCFISASKCMTALKKTNNTQGLIIYTLHTS